MTPDINRDVAQSLFASRLQTEVWGADFVIAGGTERRRHVVSWCVEVGS